jgi:bacterioferritin (cytochrome b1)
MMNLFFSFELNKKNISWWNYIFLNWGTKKILNKEKRKANNSSNVFDQLVKTITLLWNQLNLKIFFYQDI